MEIRVYFCAVLYNEDTEIIQIVDQAKDKNGVDAVSQLQNSKTTLSKLYQEGWRLINVVHSHETKGYRFFLEKA